MIKKIFRLFKESPNSFEGQEDGEKVVLLVRKHFFPVSIGLSLLLSLGLIPILIWLIFYSYLVDNGVIDIFVLLSSLYYLFLLIAIFNTLTIYSLNTLLITNKRIIHNEQHKLFNRESSEVFFSRIQDVTTHTHGVFKTFLKYGTVLIQTAARDKEFSITDIPKPERIKNAIMNMVAIKNQQRRDDEHEPPVHNSSEPKRTA